MAVLEEQYQKELEAQRGALLKYLQRQASYDLAARFGVPTEQVLMQWMRDRLESIECALERFTNDEFGFCQKCHRQINPERLNALPDAELCIECQQGALPRVHRKARHTMPGKTYQGGSHVDAFRSRG
jgi:RNA polymerase-binding transcription factor DksA